MKDTEKKTMISEEDGQIESDNSIEKIIKAERIHNSDPEEGEIMWDRRPN